RACASPAITPTAPRVRSLQSRTQPQVALLSCAWNIIQANARLDPITTTTGWAVTTSPDVLPLDRFLQREQQHPQRAYMVQPLPDGSLLHLSWADVGDQARRAAAWLRALNLEPGSRIAILSKNCAHWIITDL